MKATVATKVASNLKGLELGRDPCLAALRGSHAMRPCSLDDNGLALRLGHLFSYASLHSQTMLYYRARELLAQARKRHDTTKNSDHQRKRNEKEKKKRHFGMEDSGYMGLEFWNRSSTSIDREFNILSTFDSFPCLQQTWPLVWIDRNGYPNGKQRMLHAVESLLAPCAHRVLWK